MSFSTYEAFNVILRKWTSAIQHLGASPNIKQAVMSLWFLYLHKRGVAFFKDYQSEKDLLADCPSKYTSIAERDLKSIKKQQLPTKPCRKERASLEEDEKLKKRITKKRLSRHMSRFTISKNMSKFVDDLEGKSSSEDEMVNKTTQEDLFQLDVQSDDQAKEDSHSSSEDQPAQSLFKEKRICSILERSPLHLTLDKLLGLFYLAILLSREDILLVDLIRWCKEGFLPYTSASYLLENDMSIEKSDSWIFRFFSPTYGVLSRHTGLLACFLSVQQLPLPPFGPVLDKFVQALALPEDIKSPVISILNKLGHQCHASISTPPIELYVAAAILLTLKITFGVDDYQEQIFGSVANKINKMFKKKGKSYRVFSWTKWQTYVNSLLHFVKEVNPSLRPHGEEQTSDTPTVKKRFFTGEIWNHPKMYAEENEFSKNKWKMCEKAMELKGQSFEKELNQKWILKPYAIPFQGVVEQYIERGHRIDKSEGKAGRLETAIRLRKTTFSEVNFDWPSRIQKIATDFKGVGVNVAFETVSLLTNEKVVCNDVKHSPGATVEKIVIPNACSCFWLLNADPKLRLHEKHVSQSFLWLLRVFENLCYCTTEELAFCTHFFEKKYMTANNRLLGNGKKSSSK